MKLVKYEKPDVGSQRYFYVCVECGKEKVSNQNKNDKSDYCHSCYLKHPTRYKPKAPRTAAGYYVKKPRKHICSKCGVEFESLIKTPRAAPSMCIRCSNSNHEKRKNCTSEFKGVSYQKTNKGLNGYWHSKIIQDYKIIFFCKYKDSDIGTDIQKQELCAINREMFIIDNNLVHRRNFSDEELSELKTKYVRNGML